MMGWAATAPASRKKTAETTRLRAWLVWPDAEELQVWRE